MVAPHRLARVIFLVAALALAACSSDDEDRGKVEIVEGFAGLVAGDEPRAVLVGRDILGVGGTAMDAAVAMAFTMTVTMPSRAAIGGGGACVVFDSNVYDDGPSPEAESYSFIVGTGPDGALIPLLPRAMGVLHARHGVLRWEMLLAPAERLARFGHPVSRAFAQDIRDTAGILVANPDLRQRFSNKAGALASEGDVIAQDALSGVLGTLRRQGAGYLYSGPLATRLVAAAQGSGLGYTVEGLAKALPEISEPLRFPLGRDTLFLARPAAGGALLSTQIFGALSDLEDYVDEGPVDQAHMMAEASLRAFAGQPAWMTAEGAAIADLQPLLDSDGLRAFFADYDPLRHKPADSYLPPLTRVVSDPYSAGFVTADRWGGTVACSFSMNGLFGAGRVIPDVGILVAARPRPEASELTPVVVGNEATGDLRFAGLAAGGRAAPAALATVMLLALDDDQPLDVALAAPRVTHIGLPDVTWVEPDQPADVVSGLEARGHRVLEAPRIGLVMALVCLDGILHSDESCEVANDPRGHGLAVRAQ